MATALANDDHPPLPRLGTLLVLYNDTREVHRGDPTDLLPNAEEGLDPVLAALAPLADEVRALGVSYANLGTLARVRADFVLNLCDGTGLDGHPGVEVVAALERRASGYSGAGPRSYWLTCSKPRMKQALAAAGVPVPLGFVAERPDVSLPRRLRYPLFVKPSDGYGSLGVDARSCVRDKGELLQQIGRVLEEVGPGVLVEQYIEGREISVGLLGPAEDPELLPPLEVVFGASYALPVRTFATKHQPGSAEYQDFSTLCPATLEPEVLARVEAVARKAYAALGCDGYARVDMRVDAAGAPWVLEVNANCSLELGESDADCALLPLMARAHGWTYGQLLARIVEHGRRRPKRPEAVPAAAVRWRDGQASLRALRRLRAGERLPELEPAHLRHAATPNLRVREESRGRGLEVLRDVRAGQVLTVERARP